MAVLPAADHVEEDALLVAQRVVERRRVAEAPVVEGLGALDDGDARVGHVADHPLDQLGARNVVGVEGDDELRVQHRQDVVDVAGLRVQPRRRAADVAGAHRRAHLLHPRAAAVVEHADLGRHVVADPEGAHDRGAQDVLVLVVGRDQDGHAAALQRLARRSLREAPAGEGEQGEHDQAVGLGEGERDAEPQRRPLEGEAPPPHQVAARGEQRRERQGLGDPRCRRPRRSRDRGSSRRVLGGVWGHPCRPRRRARARGSTRLSAAGPPIFAMGQPADPSPGPRIRASRPSGRGPGRTRATRCRRAGRRCRCRPTPRGA